MWVNLQVTSSFSAANRERERERERERKTKRQREERERERERSYDVGVSCLFAVCSFFVFLFAESSLL